MESICAVYILGQVGYQSAWDLQNRLAGEIASGNRPPTLLLLEHPHTFTIGRRGGWQNILWDVFQREEHGVAVIEVDRGGDITYHGPGQLVGYPLLPLALPGWQGERLPQADFVGYLRRLETTLIVALESLGIEAFQRQGYTGVWANPPVVGPLSGKIASIGVKIDSKGISRHGFALNVSPDRTYWSGIVPCGLDGVEMLSLDQFLDPLPSSVQVTQEVIDAFAQVFGYKIVKIVGETLI